MDDNYVKTQRSMVDSMRRAAFVSVILILISAGSVGAVTPITGSATTGCLSHFEEGTF